MKNEFKVCLGSHGSEGIGEKTVYGIAVSINDLNAPMICARACATEPSGPSASEIRTAQSGRSSLQHTRRVCCEACLNVSVQYATLCPNTIRFTSHIFAHLCLHLSVQAANKCLKTHVGLLITSDSAAKSKWLQHDALSNFKLGMTKLTGIRHKHHKQEMAAHV
jgi:hypothetical protein